jgi:hypothetical protein
MKKVAAGLAMGFVLATATAAQAGSDGNRFQQVAECKTQLTAVYGEDAHVRTIGKVSVRGSAMTFSVSPQGERRVKVTCTPGPDGNVSVMDRYGFALAMPAQHDKKAPGELF